MRINNLSDVKAELSKVYDRLDSGQMEIKDADSRANVLGKYIKADALEFAKEVFRANRATPMHLVDQQPLIAGEKDRKRDEPGVRRNVLKDD